MENKQEMVQEASRLTLHLIYGTADRNEKKILANIVESTSSYVENTIHEIAKEILDGGAIELAKADIIIAIKSVLTKEKDTKKRKTMLDEAIEDMDGKCVLAYVGGMYSYRKNSNLYRTIVDLGLKIEDRRKKWDVAVGAHRQSYYDGFQMAIVAL